MHVISIGDSIFIWDVLAWTTPRPALPNVPSKMSIFESAALENIGQPRHPPEPFQYNGNTARTVTRSLSTSEVEKTTIIPPKPKYVSYDFAVQLNNIKFRKKDAPPAIRRHFIQRTNNSQLAKVINLSIRNIQSTVSISLETIHRTG